MKNNQFKLSAIALLMSIVLSTGAFATDDIELEVGGPNGLPAEPTELEQKVKQLSSQVQRNTNDINKLVPDFAAKANVVDLKETNKKVTANQEAIALKADQTALTTLATKKELKTVDSKLSGYTTTEKFKQFEKDVIATVEPLNKRTLTTLSKINTNKAETDNAIALKANADDVYTKTKTDELIKVVDDKFDGYTTTTDLNNKLDEKADKSKIASLTGEIERAFTEINKGKASDKKLNEVATDLESKITENKTALDTKVAQDEFDTLKTTVGNKANADEVYTKDKTDELIKVVDDKFSDYTTTTDLNNKLDEKADKSKIASLTGEIERAFTEINKGKASDKKLNEVATDLESKITENKTALDTKVAQDEFDTLKTTVGNKAEKTALDTLTATVDT
ncbi:hypothetical protein QJU23_08845, partial [Pasteurella atlantica]